MGVSMFLAGGLSRAAINNPSHAPQYGAAAASFTFIFTAGFGATWLTIPWLYPAEIFPLQIRAKGNAWGVVGWCIGNGWTVSSPPSPPKSPKQRIKLIPTNTGPPPPHNVQAYQRKSLLHLRRRKLPHHPHRLGPVPRIQPTYP